MNILKLYKETENKEHREWFLLTLLLLLGLLAIVLLIVIFEQGSREYYRINGGLFIIDIMIFLIFIRGQQKTKTIFSNLKRIFDEGDKLKLSDYGDILALFNYATAMISFVFILDLSFMENYGIKIGAVVAVNFVKLLKDLYFTKK